MSLRDQLLRTKRDTLRAFSIPAEDLERRRAPDKWSARVILQHLADSEVVYLYRARRVISQPAQVIWATDQDAWAEKLEYATAPMEVARRLYETARDALIETVDRHYAGSERTFFVHSERGRLSLRELFDGIATHNANHLDQIAATLGDRYPRD